MTEKLIGLFQAVISSAASTTVALSAAVFFAVILCLAIPPARTKKLLGYVAALIGISALCLYGYGYHAIDPDHLLTNVLRTVLSTCKIFVGGNPWNDIDKAYINLAQTDDPRGAFWQFIFWLVHMIAMFTSASAVIVSLGSKLLKKIRLRLFRRRDISLIYGLNKNTLEFGQQLIDAKASVVYVDPKGDSVLQIAADQMGAVVRSGTDALEGSPSFLRSLGMKAGRRKLQVYALSASPVDNFQYATRLLNALCKAAVPASQITLTILENWEYTDHPLQEKEKKAGDPESVYRYGYSSVISISEPDMVARILIQKYPPFRQIRFDKAGRATSDFHGLVIGFGAVGQAVLRHLVMNSQFCGGKSRIFVFAPDYEEQSGHLAFDCAPMLKQYNIEMLPYDGRSRQFYDYITRNCKTINYVAICTGSDAMNTEIFQQLQPYLKRRGCTAPILMCAHNGVFHFSDEIPTDPARKQVEAHKIYIPELLCPNRVDDPAMLLNYAYSIMKYSDTELSEEEAKALVGDPNTDWEIQGSEARAQFRDVGEIWKQEEILKAWKKASYFNRMSSRAAADFHDALLYCADVDETEAVKNWDPQGQLLINLAESEHLRWNAFHYCMGFRPMTEKEYATRLAHYKKLPDKKARDSYRISKDMVNRTHACIIPWDRLDILGKKETLDTGRPCKYKLLDYQNVQMVKMVLQQKHKLNPPK